MMYTMNYWGMDLIWWFLWMVMLVWIFAIPYDIPGQRNKKDGPLAVLLKRYAAGEIGIEEYNERKKIIEMELIRRS